MLDGREVEVKLQNGWGQQRRVGFDGGRFDGLRVNGRCPVT